MEEEKSDGNRSMEIENGEQMQDMKKKTSMEVKMRRGGIRTMPFILANEVCDRFASTGIHANMITYLTQELNLPLVKASNILSNFAGISSFTPLIGALIADSFVGRFWTILVASIIYELGMATLTTSAVLPHYRPPSCPTPENCVEASARQLWVLYICLLVNAAGSGGIRPCVVTFAADQLDMSKAKRESQGWNFFNLYYFCIGLASLSALTVVVYIQDQVGWGWGLGLPTIAMGLSIFVFVVGFPLYNRVKPGGSPLVRLAQVIVAAARKRKAVAPADPGLLYENRALDADISNNGRLLHTNQLRWFDRAAIVIAGQDTNPPNLWKLATVHRVEELKSIIRMLPIWAAGILLVASNSHVHSFTVVQARTMNRHLSRSFEISPASLAVFSVVTVLVGLALYERAFVPIARRFTGNPVGVTCLQRMGIGLMINILGTTVAALVELKRKSVAADHHLLDKPTAIIPIRVFWLVPQFIIHGLAEVFISVGHLEFLYDQSPESLRSTAVALYSLAISVGSYIGTLMVSMVHKYTGSRGNWLPNRNLNRGRLDCYYWLLSGVQVINLMYFVVCAWFYTCKPLEEKIERCNEGDVELVAEQSPQQPYSAVDGNAEIEGPRESTAKI